MASSGAHVTLPDFYGSSRIGMIIPKVGGAGLPAHKCSVTRACVVVMVVLVLCLYCCPADRRASTRPPACCACRPWCALE